VSFSSISFSLTSIGLLHKANKWQVYPSEMSTPLSGVADSTKAGAVAASTIPATRTGSEMDMAGVILGLVGKAGAYYNGSVMVTDGGRLGILPGSY